VKKVSGIELHSVHGVILQPALAVFSVTSGTGRNSMFQQRSRPCVRLTPWFFASPCPVMRRSMSSAFSWSSATASL
jgi:hypothetical protein